ncbi:MAG: amino acid adenylation domain-containing protein [Propionicimonas sp.]
MSRTVAVFPCSSSQRRLWLLEQLGRGGRSMTVQAPLLLKGTIEPEPVRFALELLVRRHESLRTTFAEVDGHAVQLVHPAKDHPIELGVTDLSGSAPPDRRQATVRALADSLTGEPFDLSCGPLVRAHLVRAERSSVLLLAFHHIVVDGWSVGVLHDELRALLSVGAPDVRVGLPPLPVQYADFALWEQRQLPGDAHAQDLAWWQELHRDAPDRPALFGPDQGNSAGGRVASTLDARTVAMVRGRAAASGATAFSVLLTAYSDALHAQTGQSDLVIGTPVAGRGRTDLEGVVGFFVNTLPLRVRVDPHSPTAARVAAVHAMAVEAIGRQQVPFEEISRLVGRPDRPLFEAMFNLLEGRTLPAPRPTTAPLDGVGTITGTHGASAASAHAAVELYVMDFGGERIDLELAYATGQLDEASAVGLLTEVVARLADPEPGSAGAEAVPAPIVRDDNENWPGPAGTDLISRFFRVADEHPGAPAIRSATETWTYAELAEQVRRIGAAITAAGVRHERIGVLAGHDANAVAAVLGVLAAGAAYVPLDTAAPEGRLAAMITDAGLHLILHDGSAPRLRDALAAAGVQWADIREMPSAPTGWRPSPVDPDAVAYLLYTSGTTGQPKGVVQSHHNVLTHLRNYADSLRLAPGDILTWLPAIGTDAAVMDVFGALLTGACLQPIEVRSVGFDELPGILASGATTILHATPTLFRAFVGYLTGDPAEEDTRERFAGLRAVVLGGEAATNNDLATVRRWFPKQTLLINGYGPTECTVALQFAADSAVVVRGDALPLGHPVPGVSVSILDEAGNPVPPGGVGEIVLHSRQLCLGYWRRPEETAERFVPGPVPGYRTGDLGRVHPDGTITFAGRADDQFKIHGVRIEATEVEQALRRQPGVSAAAVTHTGGLTAYLVVAEGAQLSSARVRRGLRRLLPDAMIPSRFLQVDRLPLASSGKIDRGALAASIARPLQDLGRQATAPVDRWHAAVAAVWAEVLDLDPDDLGPDDTFFDFGGHSLLMTQVAARLEDRLAVRIPLRTLFDNPSVAELAAVVAELAAHSSSEDATTGLIPRLDRSGPVPLSSAQARLWFLEQLNPGTATYTMNLALPVEEGSTLADVQATVDQLMARHEALRTTFEVVDGTPWQRVNPSLRVVVRHTELAGLDPDAAAARRSADSTAVATTVFDLLHGPLLRAHFIDLGRQGGQLLLAIHHIVADGWSLGLLRREVGLLLAASRDGKALALSELPIQYPDYAVWEQQQLARGEGGAWWRDALHGIPERLELPQTRPRPAQPTSAGGLVREPFEEDLARRLRRLARTRGVTPFVLYLAGFATVLHRWSGQSDLVIGTPVAGRTRVEVEGVVGLFVNSLPLRVPVEPEMSFTALLDTVRNAVGAAQDHQSVPFEEIVRQAAPHRRLAAAPIFQVMFALGSTQDEMPSGDVVSHTGTAKFDLSMTVDDSAVPGVFLEYSADIYDDVAARQLARALVRLLEAVAEEPDRPLSRIPLGPDHHHPEGQRPQEFTPDQRILLPRPGPGLAVVGPGTALTHSQLVDATGRWVSRLCSLDLPTGSVVAVDLPRGPELIAAMLAVPAAGLCLLLLDPGLPESRRRDLLERSGARAVLGSHLLASTSEIEALDTLPEFDPDLPAYIVATSGTTGTPKLVVVPRRALAAQVTALSERYQLGPTDRVLQFSALGFDVAVEEIWPTIAAGGCIELGPSSGPPTFDELATLCGPGGVTVLNLPASYWHAWVAVANQRADGGGVPAGLRLVVVGSEPVHPQAVAWWHGLTRCQLLCAYGTSETTITNAVFEPPREWPWHAHGRVPIGRALPTSRLLVVDPDGHEVPPGVQGELAVEGVCVADGYLGDPDLTARRFLTTPTGRRYLTGDLARLTLFGAFEVLGRLDDQVKLAGHRIEPGEVEAALLRLPGVRAAAVAIRARADGRQLLVGYLVGDPPAESAELRQQLLRQLPEHLVPSEFMSLVELPLTANGKLDRSRLPLPVAEPPAAPTGRALAGGVEWTVAHVWAEVLQLPLTSVSADSNFFQLGGDSILSLQVAWRLSAKGVHVSLAELFQYQSVGELAAAIEAVAESPGAPDGPASQAGSAPTAGPIPLLPIQKWALAAGSPDPSHDNQAVLVQVDGAVPDDSLRAALAAVITLHEALRSRFVKTGGEWHVEIADAIPLAFDVHEPGAELSLVAARSHASLSLAGPLIRADLLPAQNADGERDHNAASRLLIVAHHLVVDFVSWQILLDDLGSALLTYSDPPAPPVVASTWSAWSRRLAEWANGPEALADARWWLDRMGDDQGLVHLPAGAGAPGGEERDQRVLRVVVDHETTRRIIDVLRALDAGIEDALVAVVGRAIADAWMPTSRSVGQTEVDPVVLVDVEGHGREPLFIDVDPARIVGWLTTLRPVPVRAVADATVADQVLAVRESLHSMPRHGIGYGAVRELRTVPDPDADALRRLAQAQVSVNYLGRAGASSLPTSGLLTAGGPPPGPNRSPESPRPYTFDVVAMVRDEQLVMWWSYAGTLTPEDEVTALAGRSVDLLAELATTLGNDLPQPGGTPVASYPLTPMQEAMVFGASSGRGSGVNVEQSVLPLPAGTDAGRLLAAWQRLVARHDVLRTRFVEDSAGTRRQEVLARVRLPWRTLDWRHLSESAAAVRLAELLAEDRFRGFAIDLAPLMRLTLIQFATGPQLLWSHHHALLDGWSAREVLDELTALLGSTDGSARLPVRASFRSHLAWLAKADRDGDRAYWAAQFPEPARPAPLPLAPANPSGPLHAALGVPVGADLSAGLVRRAAELGVSPATIVQAAWALTLGAHTGTRDVVFGVISSGRPAQRPESASIIGLMITTHPCRVPTPSAAILAEWIRELAVLEIANREHAHAGLIEISRSAGLPLDAPPFDTLFVVENYRRPASSSAPSGHGNEAADASVRDVEVREAPDVALSVVVGADYGLRIIYDSRRLDRGWVSGLLTSLMTAIRAIVEAGPGAVVGSVDVLGRSRREQLLRTWNDTARPLPAKSLGLLWAESALRHGGRVAVVEPTPSGVREVTYDALANAALTVAKLLRARGVRPGDLVGVAAERSAEFVAAVLGIVQAGAAYVPLDAAYPDDRLAFLVADTGMRAVVTRRNLLARLPGKLVANAVIIDELLDAPAQGLPTASGTEPESTVDPESPAYVIYTSGSTGQPKGVVVPHRAVARLVIDTDYVRLGTGDTVAMASNVAFDASTFELWAPLLSGARVAILDSPTMLSPHLLGEFLNQFAVSVMFLTTAAFNTVAAEEPTAFAGLDTLMFGGERVDPGSVRRVLRSGAPRRLLHVYGPTEATTFASWHEVREVSEDALTVPIGRPIANTALFVLDEDQRLVAPGAEGELCIGGPGLALGYLGDPDLTTRRFVPHPYQPGELLYRTGDTVVQDAEGVIEIRGRTDEQVKIRGFRIEPGEIESHLRSAPGVAGAVVVPRREGNDIHFLAAYVTPLRDTVLEAAGVRSFLRERLPAHLVPATLTVLKALPLTPNGKINRLALPDPRAGDPATAGLGDEQPGTDFERAVASIWGRVLRMDPVSIARSQDFFELGGHSLLLTQVAARLRDEFEVEIPLRVLFDVRTLGELASLVSRSERTPQDRIPVADRADYFASIDEQGRLITPPALRARLFVEQ